MVTLATAVRFAPQPADRLEPNSRRYKLLARTPNRRVFELRTPPTNAQSHDHALEILLTT